MSLSRRRESNFSRAREAVPAFAIIGAGIVAVFVAMNILVASAPVVINRATPTSTFPSFPPTPSVWPSVSESPSVSVAPTASVPLTQPTLVHSAVSMSDPRGVWTVYILFPGFVRGTTPWADQMNDDMRTQIEARASQWAQGPAADRQAPGRVNTLTGDFTTELLTPEMASFTLTWSDVSMTADPVLGVETLNFDLSTGQRMPFDDMFTDPTEALAIISANAQLLLQTVLGAGYDSTMVSFGAAPVVSNFIHWALTRAGIKFTFDQYRVTMNGSLLPSVVVPWGALRRVMVPTGPVARLAGF